MIEKINNCSGCYACYSACPKQCIRMESDQEGFWYPKIDYSQCINCCACQKACPILNKPDQTTDVPECFAAKNIQEEIRLKSSSGGVFSLIAEEIISQGGKVFGAAFDECFNVKHLCIENVEELEQLRGSKYVQSKVEKNFILAREYLEDGKILLFTGTPCQIAGLLSFLRKDYDNLYTQDIVCHGVPSPLVWNRYMEYHKKVERSTIQEVGFRDKTFGWSNFATNIKFDNSKEYCRKHSEDPYMKTFLKNVILRPSCYSCKFKGVSRSADITLADFWGIDEIMPDFNDDKGVSLVMCHTEKGKRLFKTIASQLVFKRVDLDDAIRFNSAAVSSVNKPKARDYFMTDIKQKKFEKCYDKYCDENGSAVRRNQFMQDIGLVKKEKGIVYAVLWTVKNIRNVI